MKKILFLNAVALLCLIPTGNAQVINAGFETWTNDILVPSAMNPNSGNATTGWIDYNFYNSSFLGNSPISVTRCTDTVHSGNYAVRLQTKAYTQTSWNYYNAFGIPFIGHAYNDTLGILFNGNVNVNNQTYAPGIPFTQKITQFSFYYQYKPTGNDTAECRVLLVNQRNPIAGGTFKTNVATGASGWQQATINLTYISSLTPDTLWVLMSSSSLDKNPKAGSILWIDDVSVGIPTGVNELIDAEDEIEVYPNPSTGEFTLQLYEQAYISVLDVLGKVVYKATLANGKHTLNLNEQTAGVYILKVISNGKQQTKRLIKH